MADEPVNPIQTSFARGEVSPFLFGRTDLAGWAQGLRTLRNFTVRPEGCVSNRQGFGFVKSALTATSKASILIPFIFSATQSYVIEVGAATAQVFSNGALVIGATFATPWAAGDLALLRWAQSTDTLTLTHPKYPPYEIKRTSASSFTCVPAVYINGPFLQQNNDGTTFVSASAVTGTVTLISTAPIFNANHVGALFQLTQQDLSNIQPWEPTKQFAASAIIGQYRRANLKNYKAVSLVTAPAAQNCTGTWIPSHSQGTQADGDGNIVVGLGPAGVNWQYQDSGFGVVLITGFTDSQHVTGVVQPNYTGGPGLLPTSVVGGPITVFGPFTFSGTGATTSFGPMGSTTSADPSKYFVTIGGVYVSPSTYTVVAAGNITFLTPPVAGTNNIVVRQISQLGETTFWAFGAISPDQGYPSTASYFPDRLILAATVAQPVGVFGSKTSLYHDFGVSNPVIASDAFTVFLNARQLNAISDLIPLSDLLVGTSNISWRLWPGSTGVALSPLAISANPQSFYGQSPTCASVLFGDSAIFPEYDGRRLRDLIYQFAYDKFLGQELTLYSRHLIPFGTQFQRLAYKPDPTGQLVFGLRTDGTLLVCTYLRDQQVIGWARWDTLGTFEDICVVPENTTFALYAIVNRVINKNTVRYVERLENREVTTIYDYQFLDCNITYDGRNTSTTTMSLSQLNTGLAGDTGFLLASSTSGWAGFAASDVTNKNEIWIYQPFTFLTSLSGQSTGVLTFSVAAGTYILTFSDGESRSVTVAADGITCSWQGNLATADILTATCRCRLLIISFISNTGVNVRLKDPCPAGLQNPVLQAGNSTTVIWTFARTTFSGATQIANAPVVGFVDANVIGMNANGIYPNGALTVSASGVVTLPVAGGVVQVGLPYLCDFETLTLNEQGQQTIRMRAKVNPVIYLDITESRNFLAGTDFSSINQWPNVERAFEPYVASTALQAGIAWTRVNSELSSECHTCVRQNMPLPLTIRAHIPQVTVGASVS
jgi:hypothetical protein